MITRPFRHLNRHRQMIQLLYKYGRSDLIQKSGLAEQLSEGVSDDENDVLPGQMLSNGRPSHDWDQSVDSPSAEGDSKAGPEDLANDLEAMGPAFIKLGQLLSTRPDFLPKTYRDALSRLQDDAEPIETREVFRVIEEELGEQPEYLFASFETEPLATASLGQVHRARMNCGQEVVVKVQRPGIVKTLNDDIEAMEELAGICEAFAFGKKYQLKHLVESLKNSLAMELDYRQEAANAITLRQNMTDFPEIVVPQPIASHSTQRVITMQFVQSEKITELPDGRLSAEKSECLAEQLFKSFLHQVLVHGAYHADPHPGNVGLTGDDQLVLMDHGLIVKVPPNLQADLIKLLLAITDGQGEEAAKIAEKVGLQGDDFDSDRFRLDIQTVVAKNIDQNIDQMDTGVALMQIQRAAGEHQLWLPQEVILLGRSLMHLERIVSALDGDFDPNESLKRHAMEIMREHSGKKLTLSSLYQTFLESTEFVQKLPARANQLAEMVTTNGLEVRVKAIDETRFIAGLNKVANRISTGLIISAMIIAAALMMRLDTQWKILGYPAIAFMFFAAAAIAGGILVWRVLVSDRFES